MKRLSLLIFMIIVFLNSSICFAGSLRVENASENQISLIKVLLNPDVVILKSAAIKSAHHKRAYYIGIVFNVSGVDESQTGVWIVSGDKDRPGSVLSVDGFAQNFSRATAADKTNPPTAYGYDDECKRLKKFFNP